MLRAGPYALFALGWVACSSEAGLEPVSAPAGAPNLLLISIDSLRPDHLGCYGYGPDSSPFIDSLASEGLVFENGLSTTSWTLPAHAAMFTGLRDSVHGLVDNGLSLSAEHVTLAEVLRQGGYRTAGFFGGPYLHPVFGVGQGFEEYVNCMGIADSAAGGVRSGALQQDSASHADVTGPRTRQAIASWAAIDDSRPYFLFVHLWDVHYDYRAPDEYLRLFDADYTGSIDGRLMSNAAIEKDMDPRDLEHVLALYDAEIRFTDDVLRDIFDDLGARGMLENTLTIVTADHGEEFFEHGRKGHNKTLYDEVLRIPLIMHWPGEVAAGQRNGVQVQLIDLMPTLIRAAGVDSGPGVQGRDLGPLMAGGELAERDALAELLIDGQGLRALRSNKRKVIEVSRGGPAFFLDLLQHPGEDSWLRLGAEMTAAEEQRRAQGQRELDSAVQRSMEFKGDLEAGDLELGDELNARLRALGYLGDDDE